MKFAAVLVAGAVFAAGAGTALMQKRDRAAGRRLVRSFDVVSDDSGLCLIKCI